MSIHHIFCISGFQQQKATRPGTWQLCEKLRARGLNSGLRLRCSHHVWNARWADEAAEVANLAEYYEEPARVAIFAYSWGAGYGAMELARQLYRRGQQVDKMVVSDSVYRHPWFLFRWLALSGAAGHTGLHFLAPPVIRIPPNVREVWSYFQRQNRPQGHGLVATGETRIHQPVQLNRVHGGMDDAPEFHGRAIEAARELVTEGLTDGVNPAA